MKMGIKTPGLVIHTSGLEELGRRERQNGRIILGPALTHSEIAGSDMFNLWKPLVPAGVAGTWAPVRELAARGWSTGAPAICAALPRAASGSAQPRSWSGVPPVGPPPWSRTTAGREMAPTP